MRLGTIFSATTLAFLCLFYIAICKDAHRLFAGKAAFTCITLEACCSLCLFYQNIVCGIEMKGKMKIFAFFYIINGGFNICKNQTGLLLALELYIFSDFFC